MGIGDPFGATAREDGGISGLSEAFRKERAGMQKVGRHQAEPELTPEQQRDAAIAERVARGAVDPTTLLTYDDVEAYTGDRIDDSVVGFAPSFVSVAFNGVAGTYRLASIHGGERSRWNAAKTWKQLRASYDDAEVVADLGDAAFRTAGFLLVRRGEAIVFVEVLRDDLGLDATRAMAAVLLRGALANLTGPVDR